ncbi:MAG: hypothetical protein ACTSXZ_01750, partial [Alphaproteobacteria bacterium]
LDKRIMNYHMTHLMAGLGYRFLYGPRLEHSTTLHGKLGVGGAGMSIDGLAAASGASGILEIGANYFHRFENQMLVGVQLDFRFWGAGFSGIELDAMQTEAELGLGGAAALLSLIVGWETL